MTRRARQHRLLAGALTLLAYLPLPVNHALGALLGQLAWWLAGKYRRIALRNLEHCFPEQSPTWRRRIARQSFRELGKAVTEAPWLWKASPATLRRLLRYPAGYDLTQPRPADQALFLVTPHLGSWEFSGLHAATYGRLTSLYSPLRHPELERRVRQARSQTGAQLVPATRSGLRELHAARDRGEMIGLLPDQSPRRATGCFAPFFGQPALTMTLLPRLLQGRKDQVVFAFAERLAHGRGYRYHVLLAGPEIASPDLPTATAELNRLVEALIRQCPEQYNWAYKRFHPPAPGQPGIY